MFTTNTIPATNNVNANHVGTYARFAAQLGDWRTVLALLPHLRALTQEPEEQPEAEYPMGWDHL